MTNRQSKTPQLEITKELYQLCVVLQQIESARQYGLVQGGYSINEERIDEIVGEGERLRFAKPNDAEIVAIIHSINQDIASRARLG